MSSSETRLRLFIHHYTPFQADEDLYKSMKELFNRSTSVTIVEQKDV